MAARFPLAGSIIMTCETLSQIGIVVQTITSHALETHATVVVGSQLYVYLNPYNI